MASPEAGRVVEEEAQYYFDLETRKLLVGQVALDAHLEERGTDSHVRNLREILLNEEIEVPPIAQEKRPKQTKRQLLKYGSWICEVVGEPEDPNKRSMNESILTRANRLGIGPSVWEITNHPSFGSLSRFYMELGLRNTKKVGIFDNWTSVDFGDYVRRLSNELGRKPNRDDLIESHHSDVANPSLNVIISRVGSLGNLYELGGYPNVSRWEREECLDWGVKFMEANSEMMPTQFLIDYFSTKRLCPSATTLAKRFDGSLRLYQEELHAAYHKHKSEAATLREAKLSDISSGRFPQELFEGAKSEKEALTRYAKYIVVDELLSANQSVWKLSVSTESVETVKTRGFVGSIRKEAPHVTAGDVEITATWLGVFNDLWPPSKDYLTDLKVPDDLITPRRHALKKAKKRAFKAE